MNKTQFHDQYRDMYLWNLSEHTAVYHLKEPANFLTGTINPEYKNYLGKLLGPHLLVVMEIMHHCMIRATPLRPNWITSLPEVYPKDLSQILPLNHTLDGRAFHLNMNDYLKRDFDNLYDIAYMPIHAELAQTMFGVRYNFFASDGGDGLEQFRYKYNATTNLDTRETDQDLEMKDNILESMRQKYKPRQFLMYCFTNQECHDLLSPVLTNRGICYAFNPPTFQSAMANTTYNRYFQSVFSPKVTDTGSDLLGTGFKIFMVLDSQQSEVFDGVPGSFEIAVNHKSDFMSVLRQSVKVEVGYHTLIRATPIVYTTSDGFRSLPADTRQCQFLDEKDNSGSIFR
jgi:hypothetical protein